MSEAYDRDRLLESCNLKKCTQCGTEKHKEAFYVDNRATSGRASNCKACQNKLSKRSRHKYLVKSAQTSRNIKLRRKFGLTSEDVDNLIAAQEGKCKICETGFAKSKPCVDHDHKTGKVRGVLCNQCNTGLGLFKDSPERLLAAAAYLQKV